VLLAIVVYKDGGDMPYEGIRSWQIKGSWLVLNRSCREHILIPQDSFTSVAIREDKDYGEVSNGK